MSRLLDGEPWDAMVTGRIHVLVTGARLATRAFVEELRLQLPVPIIDVNCDGPLSLRGLEEAGTVVLHDVDTLNLASQQQLLEWLDVVVGRTQVVSTSSRSLLPLIATGEFLDTLYYRLNIVYFEFTSSIHDATAGGREGEKISRRLESPSQVGLHATVRTSLLPMLPRFRFAVARDTKLALASTGCGMVVGAFSMWLVMASGMVLPRSPVVAPPPGDGQSAPAIFEVNAVRARLDEPIATSGPASGRVTRLQRPHENAPPPVVSSRIPAARRSSFLGTLALDSKPSGARVSINGKTVGVTPIVVRSLPAGSRVVRVTTEGYQPWSSAVRIVANQRNLVTATLDPVLR
jgi:PEGA domain/Sigma-54 interaction domain